jgi:Ferritin-like
MLHVNRERVEIVQSATSAADLYDALQSAIELEHSTIPLYLTAELSVMGATSSGMTYVRGTLHEVVLEEMLHMAAVCNVLNAIGGTPQINKADFIPRYPGPLPMVGDFEVHLAPLSTDQLNVFLEIEAPEHGDLDFPETTAVFLAALPPHFATIGEFYDAVMQKITELGDSIFTGDPTRQLTLDGELAAVTNAAQAVAALQLIVKQGEGTDTTPLEMPGGKLAHFYRFKEIKKGKKLTPDPNSPKKYSYFVNDPITWNASEIINLLPDPKVAKYASGSAARAAVEDFNAKYSRLLDDLQDVFSGHPDSFNAGAMFSLKQAGAKIIAIKDEVSGKQAAPSFEYVPARKGENNADQQAPHFSTHWDRARRERRWILPGAGDSWRSAGAAGRLSRRNNQAPDAAGGALPYVCL